MSQLHDALNAYQSFTLTTAVYPQDMAGPYLGIGLGDEAAELLEKVAAHRTGPGKLILAECGDVMWHLAQLLYKRDILLGDVFNRMSAMETDWDATLLDATHTVVIACGRIQGRLKKEIRDHKIDLDSIVHNAARVMRALDGIARCFGADIFHVVEQNREKLGGPGGRLERNAIKGEGDER